MNIIVPGPPVPKERPRLNRKTGGIYTPKRTKEYEDRIGFYAMKSGRTFEEGRKLVVATDFFFASERHGDCDNCHKAVLDSLQRCGVIPNDKAVVEGHYWGWLDKANPRTEIRVSYA